MKNVAQLYNDYFDLYEKNYNSTNVKNEEKKGRYYKQFEITDIDNRNQETKSTKKEKTETKNPDKIQKPLWIKLNKNDFDLLTEDVYNNLYNNKSKTTIDGKAYDLRNAKKFLLEITTKQISQNEALKLYDDLIRPDATALKNSKGQR